MFSFLYGDINLLRWGINVCINNLRMGTMGPFSILIFKMETLVDLRGSSQVLALATVLV